MTERMFSRSVSSVHVACSTEKRENALRVSSSAAERRPPRPLSGTMVTRLRSVVMLRKVKISMMHHSRDVYTGPPRTSRLSQPARKIGRHASDSATADWSIDTTSTHKVGGRPRSCWKALAQRSSACHLTAALSSHACDTNASQSPRAAFSARLSASPPPPPGTKSSDLRRSNEMTRKDKPALRSSDPSDCLPRPQSVETTAASRSAAVVPSLPSQESTAPRAAGPAYSGEANAQAPSTSIGAALTFCAKAGSGPSTRSAGKRSSAAPSSWKMQRTLKCTHARPCRGSASTMRETPPGPCLQPRTRQSRLLPTRRAQPVKTWKPSQRGSLCTPT
mmetsp:Transcript_32301/g.103686  ORF Transcript_32301/g.103686 Transcript_32301/m.103686 type:complete len:334 (-) Transcript_32301:621-1622(-)